MSNLKDMMKTANNSIKSAQGNDAGGITLPIRLERFVTDNGIILAHGINLLNNAPVTIELLKEAGQTKRGMEEVQKVTKTGDTLIFESSFESRSEPGRWRSYYAQTPDNVKQIVGQKKETQTVIGFGTARKTRNGFDCVNVTESRVIKNGQVSEGSFIGVDEALGKDSHFGGAYAQNSDEMINYVMGMWDVGKDVFIRIMMKDENDETSKVTFQARRMYSEMNENELYNRSASQAKLKEFITTTEGILGHESFAKGLMDGTAAIELVNMQKWTDGASSKTVGDGMSNAKRYGLGQKGGFFSNHREVGNVEDTYGSQVVTLMVVPGQSIDMDQGETPRNYLRAGWNSVRSSNSKFLAMDDLPSPFFKPSPKDYIYRSRQQDGTYKRTTAPVAPKASQPAPMSEVGQQLNNAPSKQETTPSKVDKVQPTPTEKTQPTPTEQVQPTSVEKLVSATTPAEKPVETLDFDDFDIDGIDIDELIGSATQDLTSGGPKL
jgi:hypothetical protein